MPDLAERFPAAHWVQSGMPTPLPEEESVPYLEWSARRSFQDGLVMLLDSIESTAATAASAPADPADR
ncbi:hypothetical protein [Streptomyces sp. ODS28]|uniref:hypothetical protein n=1 Tax=Streptomyces sp. ODS28 TaxID=3136688 RepID=UPI0031ECD1E2